MKKQSAFVFIESDPEYADLVEPLIQRAMTLGAKRKAQNDQEHITAGDAQAANWKPVGVFEISDRVVMTGRALYSSGQRTGRDVARVWTVTECACDLCQTGRLVAVDQWVDEIGWRHIAKVAVRHYGQPCVDDLSPEATQTDMGHIACGLRLGWRKYGGG